MALISEDVPLIPKKKGNPEWVKGVVQRFPKNTMQEPGARLKTLVEKHGIDSILKATNSEKYLAENFSAYDGMLIIGLANSLKGSGEERERLLNRMFGKVPDKQINLNLNIDASPNQLSDKAHDMLARLVDGDDESDLIAD